MFDNNNTSSSTDKQRKISSIMVQHELSSFCRAGLQKSWSKNRVVILLIVLLLLVLIAPADAGKKREAPFESFNTTNPHESSWCPNATCHNSPLCAPCNRRYLFLVTTPRSGSTTLLHMMNLLPQTRLSGENWGEMFVAYKMEGNLHHNSTTPRNDLTDVTDGPFMHNGIPLQAMACPIQQIVHTINPPPVEVQQRVHLPGQPSLAEYDKDTILGFKTIRMHKGARGADWDPTEAANFLKSAFPCSRVVVNLRKDINQQFKSSKSTGIKGASSRGQIQENNEFLQTFANLLGSDMAKLVYMEEWIEDIAVLNSVVSWLGYQDCQFDILVHENDSPNGRSHGMVRDNTTHPKIGKKCQYPPQTTNK